MKRRKPTKTQRPKRRRGLKLVRQEDRSGCGLACVAMVTGMKYADVRRIWVECLSGDAAKLDRVGDGLTAGDLVNLLGYIGVCTLYVSYGGEGWTISGASINWTIASVTVVHGLRHWIVRDHRHRSPIGSRVLDPAEVYG